MCNSDSLILNLKKNTRFCRKIQIKKKMPDTQYKMRVNLELWTGKNALSEQIS